MRIFFGIALIVVGIIWVVMCFMAVAMMSRSVNMFTEAFLPSLLGLGLGIIGVYLLTRSRR